MTLTAHHQGRSATVDHQPRTRPKAIGFETSSMDSPRRRVAIGRHAEKRGYHYVYTVRPPEGHADPVGYALNIAIGIRAAAIIVYDLEVVGHSPARVCERFDLETVCPEQTWSRVSAPAVDQVAHGLVEHEMDPDEAHRIFVSPSAERSSTDATTSRHGSPNKNNAPDAAAPPPPNRQPDNAAGPRRFVPLRQQRATEANTTTPSKGIEAWSRLNVAARNSTPAPSPNRI